MITVVNRLPQVKRTRNRPLSIYFDGQVWCFSGPDLGKSARVKRSSLMNSAWLAGVRLHTRIVTTDGQDALYVQAILDQPQKVTP